MKKMILDVGCGSNPKGDVNIDLFMAASHRGEETERLNTKRMNNFVLADAHYLPFPSDTFNIVYASHLLEHCIHPYDVLLEFKRVSKSKVYIEVPYGPRNPNDCPFHLYAWDMQVLSHLLLRVFPRISIYTTERIPHKVRKSPKPLNIIGDLLLILFRKIRYLILWRTQITAICDKRAAVQAGSKAQV